MRLGRASAGAHAATRRTANIEVPPILARPAVIVPGRAILRGARTGSGPAGELPPPGAPAAAAGDAWVCSVTRPPLRAAARRDRAQDSETARGRRGFRS